MSKSQRDARIFAVLAGLLLFHTREPILKLTPMTMGIVYGFALFFALLAIINAIEANHD